MDEVTYKSIGSRKLIGKFLGKQKLKWRGIRINPLEVGNLQVSFRGGTEAEVDGDTYKSIGSRKLIGKFPGKQEQKWMRLRINPLKAGNLYVNFLRKSSVVGGY